MTAKEKALYLCQQFGKVTMFTEDNEGMTLSLRVAKMCALIMVEEIINLHDGIFGSYWIDVKKEIEIL